MFFLSTSSKEPSILVRALTNTGSILIIGLFFPKTLFRQGVVYVRGNCVVNLKTKTFLSDVPTVLIQKFLQWFH